MADRVGPRRRDRHYSPRAARGQLHRAQLLQIARIHRVGLHPGLLPRPRNGAAHDAGAAPAGHRAARLGRAQVAEDLTPFAAGYAARQDRPTCAARCSLLLLVLWLVPLWRQSPGLSPAYRESSRSGVQYTTATFDMRWRS